jgi:hypothetical protein
VSIKASWLRDAKVDMEALTEASFTTHKSGDAALAGLAEDEQVGIYRQPSLTYCRSKQHRFCSTSTALAHVA